MRCKANAWLYSAKISPKTRPDPFKESPSSAGCLEAPPREEKTQSPPCLSTDSATYTGCGLAVPLGTAAPPPSAAVPPTFLTLSDSRVRRPQAAEAVRESLISRGGLKELCRGQA